MPKPKPAFQHASSFIHANSSTQSESEWLLDLGASTHLSNNTSSLMNATPYHGSNHITFSNEQYVPITHKGQGILPTSTRKLFLTRILHAQSNLATCYLLTSSPRIIIISF